MHKRDFWNTDVEWLNYKIGLLENKVKQLEEEIEQLKTPKKEETIGSFEELPTVLLTGWLKNSSLAKKEKEKK